MSGHHSPALTPEELVRIILDNRNFAAYAPRRREADPLRRGINRTPGFDPLHPRSMGMGAATFAAMQVIDPQQHQLAFEQAAYLSGNDAHAEQQIIPVLERRLHGIRLAGCLLMVALDQHPCPPHNMNCLGLLRRFVTDHGMRGQVWAPARDGAEPKWAARTAYRMATGVELILNLP